MRMLFILVCKASFSHLKARLILVKPLPFDTISNLSYTMIVGLLNTVSVPYIQNISLTKMKTLLDFDITSRPAQQLRSISR